MNERRQAYESLLVVVVVPCLFDLAFFILAHNNKEMGDTEKRLLEGKNWLNSFLAWSTVFFEWEHDGLCQAMLLFWIQKL